MGICICCNNSNKNKNYIYVDELGNNSQNNISDYIPLNNSNSKMNDLVYDSPNIISTNNNSYENTFEIKMLKEINFVRTNPKKYALKLKELCRNIITEGDNEYLIPYKDNNNNNEKILLKSGKENFLDTINYLNNIEPLNGLQFCEEIKIKLKDYYKDLNIEEKFFLTSENIGKLILNKRLKILKKYNKCFFTVDIFPDPILSIVFQITDEIFNKERRNAILNKDFNFFSVNYFQDEKKKFLSILSFA